MATSSKKPEFSAKDFIDAIKRKKKKKLKKIPQKSAY